MVLLLPMALRKTGIMTLMETLGTPLADTLGNIQKLHQTITQQALYNGQVCRLEMLLNDKLDVLRGIQVVDGNDATGEPYFVLSRGTYNAQGFPKRRGQSGQTIIPSRSSSKHIRNDFKVILPSYLNDDRIATTKKIATALVNTYKLPGTLWQLVVEGNN